MTLDVLVILDRSGSMQDAKADHEGGLQSFVRDQADLDGDVRFTLVQFDSHNSCEVVYDRTPIAQVKEIKLVPRGGTPLLDAIGKAVSHLEAHKPENVVCMIVTDGYENQSREWTKTRVAARLKELESIGWAFLYLGANVDAFSEAGGLGITHDMAMGYSNTAGSGTVNAAYSAMSHNFASAHQKIRQVGASASPRARMAVASRRLRFSDDQRANAKGVK